jgi:hypothetical protein
MGSVLVGHAHTGELGLKLLLQASLPFAPQVRLADVITGEQFHRQNAEWRV